MTLTQKDLQGLLRRLDARARVLRGEVAEKRGAAADDAAEGRGGGIDAGDQSFAMAESLLDLAEAGRDIGELAAIDAALRTIERGTYGVCAQCGQAIATDRLRAYPLALRCIECQSHQENSRREQHARL